MLSLKDIHAVPWLFACMERPWQLEVPGNPGIPTLVEGTTNVHVQCEHSNQMLLKANQAMKILHFKLQKERKTVARLQASDCRQGIS